MVGIGLWTNTVQIETIYNSDKNLNEMEILTLDPHCEFNSVLVTVTTTK